jgi:tetratricopeptide (TPR) repeat protein
MSNAIMTLSSVSVQLDERPSLVQGRKVRIIDARSATAIGLLEVRFAHAPRLDFPAILSPRETKTMKPLCFVLMPFGKKVDDSGRAINFDRIYDTIIGPGIRQADLEPIRADEEVVGGFIHKPLFERLMLCDYAVADLTTANPNVFYELGVRHGIRPHSTVLLFGKGMRLPFDVAPLRALPYTIDALGAPTAADTDRAALAARLIECRNPVADSPLFQLVSDFPRPDIARLKTDTLRELVEYSQKYKARLRAARQEGSEAVKRIERELNIKDADPAVVVDIFLSYRAIENWSAMVELVPKMSVILARTVLVREQLGFALNRLGKRKEAEAVLLRLIEERGPSSETNGILGRIYKDVWKDTKNSGDVSASRGYLRRAIAAYLAGFESDWRDAYPGINAVTLMEMTDPVDPRQAELLPVVQYAVKRRLESKAPDYWDHATLVELAVLRNDRDAAERALEDALAAVREPWEPKSTSENLRMIREVRQERGRNGNWIEEIENALNRRGSEMTHRDS